MSMTDFQQAVAHLQKGDLAAAEALLLRLDAAGNPGVLRMLGFLRYRQGRLDEAAALLTNSLTLMPAQPDAQLNLGYVRQQQGQTALAMAAMRAALALKPDFTDARFALGTLLHDAGKPAEAEQAYRDVLSVAPQHALAKLGLSSLLNDAGRPADAAALAAQALGETRDARVVAPLEEVRGIALGQQSRFEEALAAYERAQAADPGFKHLDASRAALLVDLGRFEQALDLFRDVIRRQPQDIAVHDLFNNLLYCLGRDDEFLRSYDDALPEGADPTKLLFAKAAFQMFGRVEEAAETYNRILARDADNVDAQVGIALTLSHRKQFAPALAKLQAILARHPDRTNLYGDISLLLTRMGDPQAGAAMAERGLGVKRYDQFCLALLGTAWRVMGDEREEWLHGYTSLVRAFDLEPPPGYADMASFNAELNMFLDRLHPLQREYINQSLRGGTQTTNNIFLGGHALVNKLRVRIDEAIRRYIAEMQHDNSHPFRAVRLKDFRYSGAWSSRLRDQGFHVNHIHPKGWMSSCYYVAVPDAVADTQARQGWIKFGEPRFDVGLAQPIAHAIQPKPGRLVLFPSYTWHGTIPFRDAAARTTIAFDVIPT